MIRYIVLAVIAIAINTQLSAQGINFFHGTLQEALEKANKENKKVFVDVYTTWCGPCKKMAKTVFVDKEVGDFYNQHFINLKIDAEKGEGVEIRDKYRVSGYPTLLYLNPNGDVIKKLTSSADAKFFIELGKSTLNVNDDFSKLKVKFEKNDLTIDELYQYLVLLKAKGLDEDLEMVFDHYFVKASENKITEELLNMMPEYASSSESKAFQYLLQNRNKFVNVIGETKVSELIRTFYLNEFMYLKRFKSDDEYWAAKKILKSKVELEDKQDLNLDINHYHAMQDEDNYVKQVCVFIDKYVNDDSQSIANTLGAVYWVQKKENIEVMKTWAKRALELDDSFINNAQMAFIYYALKDLEEGDKYFRKAEELGKDPKYSGYLPRLNDMKKQSIEKVLK